MMMIWLLVLFRVNKTWHFMWLINQADESHEMSGLIFSEKAKWKVKNGKSVWWLRVMNSSSILMMNRYFCIMIGTCGLRRNEEWLPHPPHLSGLLQLAFTLCSRHVFLKENNDIFIMWHTSMLVKYRQKSSYDILKIEIQTCNCDSGRLIYQSQQHPEGNPRVKLKYSVNILTMWHLMASVTPGRLIE